MLFRRAYSAALFLLLLISTVYSQSAGRPNILLAISDDQSYPHTSIYGYPAVQTPAFDRVAREGVLFTEAFVQSPSCSPSRASLLTGRYPWQIEHAGNFASYFPAKYRVYPDILEDEGYFVGFTGKGWGPGDWASSGRSRNPAGNEYNSKKLDPPSKGINQWDYASNFSDFLAARPEGSPFCFWYGGKEPHRSYEAGYGERIGKEPKDAAVPGYLPDHPVVRSDLLDYCAEIEWFDQHLSQMLKMLEEIGELENTIVVVTSDNGMPFPRAKANLYEQGYHVPLAIRWGVRIAGGRVSHDLVGLIDLAPTFLEAAGIEYRNPFPLAGRSLLPLLIGREDHSKRRERPFVLAGRERHSSGRYDNHGYPQRSLRTSEFLLIRNFEPDRWPAGAPQRYEDDGSLSRMHDAYHDIDPSPTKTLIVENGGVPGNEVFFDRAVGKRPSVELYDIRTDPACLRNLADDPGFLDVRQQLEGRLRDALQETDDPRSRGEGDVFSSYLRVTESRRFPAPNIKKPEPIEPVRAAGFEQPVPEDFAEWSVMLEVAAGKYDRQNTPVFLTLPPMIRECPAFSLTRLEDGASVDVQLIEGEPMKLVWLLRKFLPAGSRRQYRLDIRSESLRGDSTVVRAVENGGALEVSVGDYPVLRYNKSVQEPPPGLDPIFRRSGYIHPLFNPAGQEVTGDFPPDHAHQHGLFLPWVNTTFEGRSVDFWNQLKGQGEIGHVAVEKRSEGPVFAEFVVRLEHRDLTAPVRPKKVLEETWTVRVYNLVNVFLVDFESRQECASTEPLKINEFHYGGLAIRGPWQWFDPNSKETNEAVLLSGRSDSSQVRRQDFLTSEGKTWVDGNHTRARWVTMHGRTDGTRAGVSILGHPDNFRAPQPVRLNPNKPYFCFAPMVLGEFVIEPGQTFMSRYRIVTFKGELNQKEGERLWNDYAEPPLAELTHP